MKGLIKFDLEKKKKKKKKNTKFWCLFLCSLASFKAISSSSAVCDDALQLVLDLQSKYII